MGPFFVLHRLVAHSVAQSADVSAIPPTRPALLRRNAEGSRCRLDARRARVRQIGRQMNLSAVTQ